MPPLRIVVLGAGGMAGHIVTSHLQGREEWIVRGFARSSTPFAVQHVDITNLEVLQSALRGERPDVVVNCVGCLVQASQADVANAVFVNSYLPHMLARWGAEDDFRLIHLSTDCVFSGRAGSYDETAFRDGDTPYARTKALGEVVNSRDVTLRTSIIGPELKRDGTGLLHWFLMEREPVRGYRDVYWSGVTTLELAKAVEHCISSNVSGLVHVCPGEKISKLALLRLCSEVFLRGDVQEADDGPRSDKSLRNTRMDFRFSPPDYRTMLCQLRDWMHAHREHYRQYEPF